MWIVFSLKRFVLCAGSCNALVNKYRSLVEINKLCTGLLLIAYCQRNQSRTLLAGHAACAISANLIFKKQVGMFLASALCQKDAWGGRRSTFLGLETRWRWRFSFALHSLFPQENELPVPVFGRKDGPHCRYGRALTAFFITQFCHHWLRKALILDSHSNTPPPILRSVTCLATRSCKFPGS